MRRNASLIGLILILAAFGLGCRTIQNLVGQHGTQFKVAVSPMGDGPDMVDQAINVTRAKLNSAKLSGDATRDPDDPKQMIVRVFQPENLDRWRNFLFTAYRLELRKAISGPNPSPVATYPDQESASKVITAGQEVLPYLDRTEGTGKFVIVEKEAIVDGHNIRDAKATSTTRGHGASADYEIYFSLDPDGAQRFGEWTGRNINNYIAVILDEKVVSVAYIKSQIFDSGVIDGRFTKQQAEDVALSLKSGYLSANLQIVEESQF